MNSRVWKWTLVVAVVALAMAMGLFSVYKQDVTEAGVRFLAERAQAASAAEVGKVLPESFQVRVSGSESPVALRSLVAEHGAVVMVYSPECSACTMALEHYVNRYGGADRRAGMPFFAMSFDGPVSPPEGFPESRIVVAASPSSDTLFDVMVRPAFWVFDRSGVVQFREIGYYKDTMNLMLDTPLQGHAPVVMAGASSTRSSK